MYSPNPEDQAPDGDYLSLIHISWYNLACSLALTEQPALALEALEKSVALGYADADWMEADADLVSLRDRPEFERILIKIRSAQAILPPPLFLSLIHI